VHNIIQGADVKATDILSIEKSIKKKDIVALFTQKGEIIARGRVFEPANRLVEMQNGVVIKTIRKYMGPGVYPKMR
jgi:H/ACA ribonucleoprotein complex subunit 4